MNSLLHLAFEEFAQRNPNVTALKHKNQTITYSELDKKSNLIANSLQQRGVKIGDIIPLLLHRSIDTIAALLGILKVGAVYLPLDPSNPVERIKSLLHESNASLVICENQFITKITNSKLSVYTIENLITSPEKTTIPFQIPKIPNNNPAIILFTSGTTGIPKGVVLTHEGLSNRILWGISNYKHQAYDVFLQQTALTFDFSIFEIFTALSCGAKLIISRPELHLEGKYLIQLIQDEKINVIGIVPSVIKLLMQHENFEQCKSLTFVFLGGEIVTPQLQSAFFKKSNAKLINIYGPTETSISVLHWECTPQNENKIVPIGFPIANMYIYLLDEQLQEVQKEEIGEIYISGIGLAHSYLNNEQLTKEKFIQNPFSTGTNKLYRTGDYGKRLMDGSFTFEGRKDKQVKINGIRIELEEIEKEIRFIDHILDCVVIPTSNKTNEIKLTAYIILENNATLDIQHIKKILSASLSTSLIPSFFIQINKIPLLSTGKIDKNALPPPDKIRELTQQSYVEPQTKTQHQLVLIWEKVLKLKPIGIIDPFDSLGGDSLKRLEIYHWIQTELNFQYPISYFIQTNTIVEQAKIIDEPILQNNKTQIAQIRKGHLTPILVLQPVQSEGLYLAKKFEEFLPPFHPVYGAVPFGVQEFLVPDSIEHCAEIYVDSLLTICNDQKFIIGGFSMAGIVAIEVAKKLQEKGKTISFVFVLDSLFPSLDVKYYNNSQQVKDIVEFYLYKLKYGNLKFWTTSGLDMIKWFPKKVLRTLKLKKKQMKTNKNIQLILDFHYESYRGKMIYFVAQTDRSIQNSWLQYNRTNSEQNLSLWRNSVDGDFVVYPIYGHHMSFIKDKHIDQVCQILSFHLKDA